MRRMSRTDGLHRSSSSFGSPPARRWRAAAGHMPVWGASLLMLAGTFASAVSAQGAAGLMQGGANELPPITLSSGMPLAEGPYELESGKYYEIAINCDGSAELAIEGPDFFRNIWVDEVIINDIEVRPMGLSSLEFDDEGTAEIKFIAIRPGTYEMRIPGTTGDTQKAVFTIK